MKPHKLTIHNFGPFASPAVIDFDRMGEGLYLISGDTGAGKTTIFDALVFALYGTASGTDRSGLKAEQYHSDYAKELIDKGGQTVEKKNPLYVELLFSAKGETYKIIRTMSWGKKGQNKSPELSATLSDPDDHLILESTQDTLAERNTVTQKITEIIGLNVDQFRQIIMLSQGEFRKFLEAKSSEREIILGKIYDNSIYKDLQIRIAAVHRKLEAKNKAAASAIDIHLDNIRNNLPADLDPEVTAILENENAGEHDELSEIISGIIETVGARTQALDTSIHDLNAELLDLNNKKEAAKHNNQFFTDLEQYKAARKTLHEKQPDIQALTDAVAVAEKALLILPFENNWKDIQEKINGKTGTKARLSSEEEQHKSLQAKYQKYTEQDALNQTTVEPKCKKIERNILIFQDKLETYDELRCLSSNMKAAQDKEKSAQQSYNTSLTLYESCSNQIQKNKQALTLLEDVSKESVQIAKEAYTSASQKQKKLTEFSGIIADLQNREQSLERLKVQYQAQAERASAALMEYQNQYTAFLGAQAALLGKDLQDKLDQDGTAVCPVCGQLHHKGDEIHYQISDHDTIITREIVDAAQKTADLQREKEQKLDKQINELKLQLEADIASLVKNFSELFESSYSYPELKDPSVIKSLQNQLSESVAALDTAFRQAAARYAQKEKLVIEQKKLEETTLPEVTVKRDHAQKTYEEAKLAASSAASSYTTKLSDLEGFPPTKKEAEEKIQKWEGIVTQTRTAIAENTNLMRTCEQQLHTSEGTITNLKKQLEDQIKDEVRIRAVFQNKLQENGFASQEAYEHALHPANHIKDLSAWISDSNQTIRKYADDCNKVEAFINQLTEKTSTLTFIPLMEFDEKIKALNSRLLENKKSHDSVSKQLSKIQDAYLKIEEQLDMRLRIKQALATVKPLHNTASNQDSPFSTFVLENFFNSILENANIHLDTLSSGKYRLLSNEAESLELQVYDEYTGKTRETGSLSGGESFEISLSLALGLSDMAQQENTGQIQVDCMFIDEGFGSLDESALQKALNVLNKLASGGRQIGIISHVASLEQYLSEKQFIVKASKKGSTVETRTDAPGDQL